MHRSLSRVAAAATLAVGALAASVEDAAAIPAPVTQVTVNGVTYNLSFFDGSYNDSTEKFNVATMPWWGNEQLAFDIAEQQRIDSNNGPTVSGGDDDDAWSYDGHRLKLNFGATTQTVSVTGNMLPIQTFLVAFS